MKRTTVTKQSKNKLPFKNEIKYIESGSEEEEEVSIHRGIIKHRVKLPDEELDESMLAWAELFRDVDKIKEVVDILWTKYDTGDKKTLSKEEGEKMRVEVNQELQKIVSDKVIGVTIEDPGKFPLEGQLSYSYTGFTMQIERIIKMMYGNMFEMYGGRLIQATYKVYEKKYRKREGESEDRDKIYKKFFEDVAKELGVDYQYWLRGQKEITDTYEEFSLAGCMDAVNDNFKVCTGIEPLSNCKTFFKFAKEKFGEDFLG